MERILSLNKNKYGESLRLLDRQDYPLKRYLPAGLLFLDLLGSGESRLLRRSTVNKLTELHGRQNLKFYLRIHQANKMVHAVLGFLITVFFGLIIRQIEAAFVCFGLALVSGLYLLPDYELDRRFRKRRRQIQREFPDFLNKITLLIGAGMTVPRAWERVAREDKDNSYLYGELKRSLAEIQGGVPLFQAYEEFAKRCGLSEINKFIAIILQNMRKGNAELSAVLASQAAECWEMRKHAARRLGEEASTKLLFPLILMFIAILIIVATPAIMAIKGL